MKLIAEQERNERLAERQRKIDSGEPIDDDDEAAAKGLMSLGNSLLFYNFFYQ